ncbi:kinesin-like protein KIF20B isoform X2 [Polistes fuscatus]|uniref:kinesin-like protein KIF20B isoform X2 n=1 Tax=Polistes fuscatus TaxID=30207 RepID=UPI001CA8A8BD|nr:kinesin-like protein KIF20B isoform X2 [Polistes fuscatus]
MLDSLTIFPLHLIVYVSRLIMISDDKPTSPIGRSTEYISIEESEFSSIDYEDDSISENLQDNTVPSFEVFLKIKPSTKKGISIFHDNSKYYEVLDSTTLISKFKPNNSQKNSKLLRTIRNNKTNEEYENCDRFLFTKIFQSETTQSEFFDKIMKQRINDFLNGHNSTIMSFGTTNSGKTYTLHGTPDQPGLIPRSIEYIFSLINCTLVPWYKLNPNKTLISLDDKERLEESEKKVKLLRSPIINVDKFTEARKSLENSEQSIKRDDDDELNSESMYAVWLSFAEIYNENIYDLLDFEEPVKNRPLKLIGDKNGQTYVHGLTTIYVTTPFEACQILVAGQSRMSSSFTNLNPRSSRSHTIFTIGLLKYQKAYAPHETEASTLTFCDLAGSGRSKGLGENIERLQEAKNINQSLLVLGRCLKCVEKMHSMKQMNENVAGPFRESKLTRIFQRTLSGQERSTFIINIDFSSELINEIKSILNISILARKISFHLKRSEKLKDCNVHTTRTNETNEILHDFKLSNNNLNDTKTIHSSEQNSTIPNESFNIKLNIDDRIDSIESSHDFMNDKKCIIGELTYREDNSMIYNNLKSESIMEKSNTNDLNEFNHFPDQIKSDISNLNVSNDECLDKLKYTLEDKKINEIGILDLDEINELRKKLSEKTMNVEMLQLQLESCERELNETENACKDAENKNLTLLKKVETLENVIKVMECDRKKLSKPKSPFYLEEGSSSPLDDKINCQIEKNHLRLSSIMENSFFCDDSNEPREFVVQAHVDIKKPNFKEIGKQSFVRKDCSNVLEMDTKNILEVSGNDLRQSNASSKNDSGIIIDESFDYTKNCYTSINSDKSICEKKEFNVMEKFVDGQLSTEIEFEENDNELKENLELNDDNEYFRMKCYQFLTCKCQCLEDLLRWIKKKRDLQKEYCKTEHLSKLDELRKELSLKTEEIDKANEQIALANRDLNKLHDLTKRLNELTIIAGDFHKNNNDLYDELRKRKDVQLNLETKLKYLVTLMETKEEDMKNMKENVTMIFQSNTCNYDKSKDLGLRIIEIKGRLDAIRNELIHSEEKRIEIDKKSTEQIEELKNHLTMYKNDSILLTRTVEDLNEKKDELIEIKSQLHRKENEMNWFKSNRDSTIKRYEYLVKQLQDEIERFKEQSCLETSELKKTNHRSSTVARTSNKFKVSESLKKLTRVGKNSDGSWRRPSYLRKKSTDEKSSESTSHFSVTRVTSSNETIVESVSENNSQFKRDNESICQLPMNEDQMLSSRKAT